MRGGATTSLLLHAAVIVLIVVKLPSLARVAIDDMATIFVEYAPEDTSSQVPAPVNNIEPPKNPTPVTKTPGAEPQPPSKSEDTDALKKIGEPNIAPEFPKPTEPINNQDTAQKGEILPQPPQAPSDPEPVKKAEEAKQAPPPPPAPIDVKPDAADPLNDPLPSVAAVPIVVTESPDAVFVQPLGGAVKPAPAAIQPRPPEPPKPVEVKKPQQQKTAVAGGPSAPQAPPAKKADEVGTYQATAEKVLTEEKWRDRDLSVLEGCWVLGRETMATLEESGKVIMRGVTRAGRLCFDKAGVGMRDLVQEFPGNLRLVCRAPITATFTPDGQVNTTQPQVKCEPAGSNIMWEGKPNSLSCVRQSESLALCRDPQGIEHEFRRPIAVAQLPSGPSATPAAMPVVKTPMAERWRKGDLSVLEGCWILGQDSEATLESEGKVIRGITRAGRVCFDNAGRGVRELTQEFPKNPTLRCSAPVSAAFTPDGRLITSQPPVKCQPETNGITWNGGANALVCENRSDTTAFCRDVQGNGLEMRREAR